MTAAPQSPRATGPGAQQASGSVLKDQSAQSAVTRPTVVQLVSAKTTAGTAEPPAHASEPVSRFIDLEMDVRRCADLDALRFAIVNSSRQVVDFDHAFLAEPDLTGVWSVTRASSVVKIDRHAHMIRAVDAWLQHIRPAQGPQRDEPHLANLEHDAKTWGLRTQTFAFAQAFWLPIKSRDGRVLAALLALKAENWRPQHTAMLLPLADVYGHAWNALAPAQVASIERLKGVVTRSRLVVIAAVAALAAAFVPVPLSALAPAEISAAEPMLVTAPIDGVISDILVAPGAWVEKGAPIVTFVDIKLRSDVEVAKRNRAVAEARYFKVVQAATASQKDMADLATTKAELDVATVELGIAMEMLARSQIRADRAGLLIYAAKSDWIGKPVAVGERLMEIGDPTKSEMKIELPVADAIVLRSGSRVSLFLDGDPLHAIDGVITRTSFRPSMTAEQQLAFRIHAKFSDGQARRIGQRGVARVSGETVPLWFYLLRRPISALRQRVGL